MPREFLRITPESTFAVYNSGGVHTPIDLTEDNSFTMRVDPKFWKIKSAAADNLTVQRGTAIADLDGGLKFYAKPAQTAAVMALLSTYTGSCPDIPSFTIDHAVALEDSCTYVYQRYLGVKATGGFSLTNTDQGVLMMLDLKLMAAKVATITGTDFATPAYSAYDRTEAPWDFTMLSGNFHYGGSDISAIVSSLSFDIGNNLVAYRGAAKYRSRISCRGRDPSITFKMLYNSAQPRIDFEASTAKSLDLLFTDALGDALEINFGNVNYISKVDDDLKLGGFHEETIMLENIVDPATGTDMAITYTAHP